jgi:hypothetical protein
MLAMCRPAGLMVLARPIVELLYQRAGPADTIAVALALQFYAPGIVGFGRETRVPWLLFRTMRERRSSERHRHCGEPVPEPWLTPSWLRGAGTGTAIAANINAALLLILPSPHRRRDGGRLPVVREDRAASAVMALAALDRSSTRTGPPSAFFISLFASAAALAPVCVLARPAPTSRNSERPRRVADGCADGRSHGHGSGEFER